MNYYDSELQRMQKEIMEKKRLSAQLSDLLLQQAELEQKVTELGKVKQEEQEDVDRLQKGSLAVFFYKATGKIDEKLSKEQAEAYAAAVKYAAAERELEGVNYDIAECRRRLSELQWIEREYQRMIEEKAKQIKAENGPVVEQILQLERQIFFLQNQKKEIDEAINAGQTARSISQKILGDLQSAKDWGTWDLIGGGLITDMMKYDKLNSAQSNVQDLQTALRNFRTELADVKEGISADIHLEIGDFLHFTDYFFDGLFTDWMVYDRISESKTRAENTCRQIETVLEKLHILLDENAEEHERLAEELEEKIVSAK